MPDKYADDWAPLDAIILILAFGLIASPWIFGYSGDKDATASSLVAGIAIAACVMSTVSEYTRIYREVDVALGVVTAAAPWLLRFSGDHKAALVHLAAGAAVALISGGELLLWRGGHPPHVST